MRFRIISLAALAIGILASGEDIVAAITTIDESTVSLGDVVASWPGNLLGALPIVKASTSLLFDIKEGTKTAEDALPLDEAGTFAVAQATLALASNVNTTLETVIGAKPKFTKLLLSPIILANLKIEQHATDSFSEAVIEKVPEEFKEVAETLVEGIQQSFDKAIEAYALF